MQVNFNNNNNDVEGIKIPKHDVGKRVLFFDHVKGEFAYGEVVQFQLVKTEQYQTVAYGIKTNDDNVLPCIPDSLVFNTYINARDWLYYIEDKLDKLQNNS